MEQAYYEEYFDLERKHWWFRARKNIIRKHLRSILPENKGLKILNVGVSTGHSSEMLAQFGKVTSIEYEQECIDFTSKKLDIEILQGSILDLQFDDNTFDLVCAFDVIEHVEDDQLAVNEMKRVCKSNGRVCLTVPAYKFLWSHHDEVNHHFRRYTKRNLLKLFHGSGQLIFHSYFNFWLFFAITPIRLLIKLFPKSVKKREGSGSDFSSPLGSHPLVQRILYTIFNSESLFISNKISLPFGISIISNWQKGKNDLP